MRQFTSFKDVSDPMALLEQMRRFKDKPLAESGKGRALGLIFFNPSLRTRLSTQKAAYNLGMNVMVLNINNEGWNIEMEDGTVMDGDTQEHVKDAVRVMSSYCDILGVRTFPGLKNALEDYKEPILNAFIKYSEVPVLSLESATLHPLQSLTDIFTIKELGIKKPKVVLTWAPHPKTLPQAVPNSFLEWIGCLDAEVVVSYPTGYGLHPHYESRFEVTHNQSEALEGADVVYCKNWSSYENYGQCPQVNEEWTITAKKMAYTNEAHFMHCLPVRRNVVATDDVLDNSLIYQQASNREWAAQAVLAELLKSAI